jgi:hypothetical protein
VTKAWGTDLGAELTSLALQVHGGAGCIEETGAAQYVRDARIAPIYEGTNGIQAIDLVTRKLTIRGGGAMSDLLDGIESLDEQLAVAGADLAPIRSQLAAGVTAVRQATEWIMAAEPADALAGATPYLRLVGVVLGGWLMARQALAATSRLATAEAERALLEAKLVTARFYCTQLRPQAAGLVPAVTAGAPDLVGLSPDQF